MKNLLENFKRTRFEFLNIDPDDDMSLVESKDDGISLIPAPQSDFTEGETINKTAVCMYTELEGDFAVRIFTDHDFLYRGDASGLLMMTKNGWAKLCFERSVYNTHSIVSTVTKGGRSDTALGEAFPFDGVWLLAAKQGSKFAFHYSPDGSHWHPVRMFNICAEDKVKIGVMAQSPNGDGDSTMNFYKFEVGACTFDDIFEI